MRLKIIFVICVLITFSNVYALENKIKPDFVKARVLKVIDGDTIIVSIRKVTFNNRKTLKNLRFTVRLIGIDTPESRPNKRAKLQSKETGMSIDEIVFLGQLAKRFTERMLLLRNYGKKKLYKDVFLEFDVEPQDKYGRLLAYVWLPDGTMLNAKIICEGFAFPLTKPPNIKYQDVFLKCFRYAREHKKGLWK